MIATAHARSQLKRFMRQLDDAPAVQEQLLLRLLRRRRDTAFGRDHRFASISTLDEYRRTVPIRTYEDLRPYIDRVLAGDVTALFPSCEAIRMFAVSSGTTDKPKHVPVTDAFVRNYRRGWNIFGVKALMDHPGGWMRPILQVSSRMDESRTASGVPCGAISGLLAQTQKRLVRRFYAVSPLTAYIDDAESRYYTIVRLAVPRDIAFSVTASPATQLRLARTAESHAERLVRDIRDGTLNPPAGEARATGAAEGMTVSPDDRIREVSTGRRAGGPEAVLARLRAALRPDPSTARRLEDILTRRGSLLPRDFWNLSFLANWTGGTLGLHLRDFPRYFGDAPVRDIGLLATEGRVSIGLSDGTPAGVLDVESAFFEFVEADSPEGAPAVRLCHELDVGETYRVVMTNEAGLYRYDLGDYIRVVGFEGRAPVIEFLNRGAHAASMTGEKLTEWQVVKAYETAAAALAVAPDAFVLAPRWDDPPFYVLYVEGGATDAERLAERVDGALREINVEYRAKRSSARLGPIAVHPLPPGLLARLDREKAARRGGANEQFKHQYLLAQPGDDDALTTKGTTGVSVGKS